MKKITYFYVYVYVYLLIIKKKKKSIENLSLLNSSSILQGTRAPYYKELELAKLEYCRRKKKRALRSSIVLHQTQVY